MSDQAAVRSNRLVAPVLVAGAVVLGVFAPTLSHALFPFIFIALFFVVVFSLCTLDRCPSVILFSLDHFVIRIVLWQLVALPAMLLAFTKLVSIPDVIAGMMLATVSASSVFAGPALVGMLGLDRDQATRCMVMSTLGMPFSLLLFGSLMGVLPEDLSIQHYVGQANFFLVIPLIIALLYWTFKDRMNQTVDRVLTSGMSWGSTLALMVFCIGAMHSISSADGHELVKVISYGAVAVLLSLALFSITAAVFAGSGPRSALLAGMLSANRNVALSAAFLGSAASSDLMVYVAVSQFPIFMFPLLVQVGRGLRLYVSSPQARG